MKLSRVSIYCVLSLLALGFSAQFYPPLLAQPAKSGPSNVLTPEVLQAVGVHLPANLPSLPALVRYQQKLATHQTITFTWDSIPGQKGPIEKSKADAIPLSGNFSDFERREHQPGPPGGTGLDVIQDTLIVIAVTETGEIRGLKAQGDRRTVHGESYPGGPPPEWVNPYVNLSYVFPDDPTIRKLVFLKPVFSSTGYLSLRKLASIDLATALPSR